jgi:hypothetical protein
MERPNVGSRLRVYDLVRQYRALCDRQQLRTKSSARLGAQLPHPGCKRRGNRKPADTLASFKTRSRKQWQHFA